MRTFSITSRLCLVNLAGALVASCAPVPPPAAVTPSIATPPEAIETGAENPPATAVLATPVAHASAGLPVGSDTTAAPSDLAPTAPSAAAVSWRPTETPVNGDVAGAEWLQIDVPTRHMGIRQLLAAAFRPAGEGPFPVVVYLHGASGLSTGMLRWAPRLSDAGFLVLAGCYTLVLPARNRVACPDGPVSEDGLAALIDVARQLPGAKQDAIGLLGLSLGARMTFWAVSHRSDIRAAVADSGHPGAQPKDPASPRTALLLLAFEGDPGLNMGALQRYEQALRDKGRIVESQYYESSRHVVTLTPDTLEDATGRTIDFFRRYLNWQRRASDGSACVPALHRGRRRVGRRRPPGPIGRAGDPRGR